MAQSKYVDCSVTQRYFTVSVLAFAFPASALKNNACVTAVRKYYVLDLAAVKEKVPSWTYRFNFLLNSLQWKFIERRYFLRDSTPCGIPIYILTFVNGSVLFWRSGIMNLETPRAPGRYPNFHSTDLCCKRPLIFYFYTDIC